MACEVARHSLQGFHALPSRQRTSTRIRNVEYAMAALKAELDRRAARKRKAAAKKTAGQPRPKKPRRVIRTEGRPHTPLTPAPEGTCAQGKQDAIFALNSDESANTLPLEEGSST